MNEIAVSDTGPLLHLAEIGHEKQLNLFRLIVISDSVKNELVHYDVFHNVKLALENHLAIEEVAQSELETYKDSLSEFRLHQTDLSVVFLAKQLKPDLVLTDDLELRKGLELKGHLVVGSIGILIRAFKSNNLSKDELQNCLDKLFDSSTLYLSKGLYKYAQKLLDNLTK